MTDKETGGPAFPVPGDGAYIPDCTNPSAPPEREYAGHSGMTLRDHFAGQALVGVLAFPGTLNGDANKSPGAVARSAYEMADAMLAERNK